MNDFYLTNCEQKNERSADYKAAKEVINLFQSTEFDSDISHGNLCADLYIDQKKRAHFKQIKDGVGLYRAIPSALLMYRLSCLFPGQIKTYGQSGYKFVWQFSFKHLESGNYIIFGEWKGGSLFWTKHDKETVPKEFERDILKLINVLVSDDCAHPYDGLVAGGVA